MSKKFSLFLCCTLAIFGYSLHLQQVQASTYLKQSCPDSITGRVIKIEDKEKVDHMMAKVVVTIELDEFDEATDSSEKSFDYPKFAINKFELDQIYEVGMRKGRVCFVEKAL